MVSLQKFTLTPTGVLAPRSAHARPSAQPPIDNSGKCLGGRVNKFEFKSYFFCDLKPHSKFWNPTITPSGRKVSGGEEKKTPLIVDSARKPLGPIMPLIVAT